jgi:hypothetical protein
VAKTIAEGYQALENPVGAYSGVTRVIEIPFGAPPPAELRGKYQMFGQSVFIFRGNFNENSLTKAGEAVGADIVLCIRDNTSSVGSAAFFRHK